MAKSANDIYKKESVPRFARAKYRRGPKENIQPKGLRSGKTGTDARRASGMFDAAGSPRRRGGASSGRGGRGGRTSGPTRANLVIIAILVIALLVYGGIFGMVRFGGKFQGKTRTNGEEAHYTKPLPPSNPRMDSEDHPDRQAPELDHAIMDTSSVFENGIDDFIQNMKEARTEINLADSPSNKNAPSETIRLLEAKLKKNPNLITLKRELGRVHYEHGQYLEAATYFGAILSADPSDIHTRLLLANAFFEGKDYGSAAAIGTWILADDKFNSDARQLLARSLMKTQDFEAAIPQLRILAEENTLDVAAQNNLGVAYMWLKKYKLASNIFEGTIKLDPSHPVGYFNLSVCYAKWPNDTTLTSRLDQPPAGSDLIQKACNVLYAAQAQFGTPFVRQWIQSSEFGQIRNTAPFLRLKEKFSINDGTVNNSIIITSQPREESFGKAILPKQLDD
jgi:tetratricopeptide (TPR) repeat protein